MYVTLGGVIQLCIIILRNIKLIMLSGTVSGKKLTTFIGKNGMTSSVVS